ncbi:PBSX family phage terminase large subunit [Microbacterium esteraromaticum]|uniref:PBSX family phage terminase large subunit n=1 Tax=Microbacterium esteraromaticum TaxID=57043 RepID=UPI002367CB84|nr:PBSX family phage terminase large subunit [Microbacterium esteraromaticum]WDH77915.1 PBSX family phage terminase large subunit [Microbacterium esteraromaticum]
MQDGATFNLWEGSIRAGKTYVSVLAFLLAVAQIEGDSNGQLLIVGKNLGSIYRNFFQTIETSEGLRAFRHVVKYRQNAPTAHIFGREVQVIGINDSRAEGKIRGMTVLLVYVDEATVIEETAFKQVLNRMSLDDSKLFATTNPDSPAHWLKTDFIDRMLHLPDWRRYHFMMDDNPSLSETVKARLRSQYTGLWYRRQILGEWVSAEGAIYGMWDPSRHIRPWATVPSMHRLLGVGLDFGTNNPSTGLLLGVSKEKQQNGRYGSRLWLIDEWRHDARKDEAAMLSPSQQARLFRDWLHRDHLPYETALRPEFIIVDPAAIHFQKELNLLDIPTAGGLNNVSYGISTVASLLAEDQLVVTDRCAGWTSEAPGYSWDSKAALNGQDVPVKVNDHSLDGGRYVIATTETMWRPMLNWGLAA